MASNSGSTASGSKAGESKNNNKLVIAIAGLAAVVAVSAGAIVYTLNNQQQPTQEPPSGGLTIDYAQGAGVYTDEEALQNAMNEAMANSGSVALKYQNNAFSSDGVNFGGRITNSPRNYYDMFFVIYADAELTDQLFMSGLLRPGSGYEKVTLDRALEEGDHTVYVAVTLVDTQEDGTQTIKGQAVHTMDFHVS